MSAGTLVEVLLVAPRHGTDDPDLEPHGPNFVGLPPDDLLAWARIRQDGPGRYELSPELADRLVRVLDVAVYR